MEMKILVIKIKYFKEKDMVFKKVIHIFNAKIIV